MKEIAQQQTEKTRTKQIRDLDKSKKVVVIQSTNREFAIQEDRRRQGDGCYYLYSGIVHPATACL